MIPFAKPILLSVTMALSGCAGAVMIAAGEANNAEITTDDLAHLRMTFPIMMLVKPENAPEKQFTGKLVGSANGTSVFTLESADQIICNGAIDGNGSGTLTCNNGLTFPFSKDRPSIRMSGINTMTTMRDDTRVDGAFGWGNHANETALRAALSKMLDKAG